MEASPALITPTKLLAELASLHSAEVAALLQLPRVEAAGLLTAAVQIGREDRADPLAGAAYALREGLGLTVEDTGDGIRPLSAAESDLYDRLCAEIQSAVA